MRRALPLIVVAVLAGCGSAPPAPVSDKLDSARMIERSPRARAAVPALDGPTYVVKKGDRLYQIALDHGQDYRELAQWNNLDDANRLLVGQVLRLSPPPAPSGTVPAATDGADTGVEVRPISVPALTQTPPKSEAPVAAVAGAPLAAGNSATYKRAPKGGVLPYAEATLARLKLAEAGGGAVAPGASATPPANQVATPALPTSAPTSAPTSTAPAAPAPVAVPAAPTVAWTWPVPGKVLTPFGEGATKGVALAGKLGEPVLAAAPGKVSYVGSGLRGYGKMIVLKHAGDYLSVYAHNDKIVVNEGQSVSAGQKIAELGSTDTDSPKLHFEIRRQGKPVDPAGLLPPR